MKVNIYGKFREIWARRMVIKCRVDRSSEAWNWPIIINASASASAKYGISDLVPSSLLLRHTVRLKYKVHHLDLPWREPLSTRIHCIRHVIVNKLLLRVRVRLRIIRKTIVVRFGLCIAVVVDVGDGGRIIGYSKDNV